MLVYINYPTDFDSTKTQAALEGTGISVPPLASYADRLWDYWERNLDPDLFKDRSLSGAIAGKVVLITGASSGIGKAAAIKCRRGRRRRCCSSRAPPEKLEETKAEIEEAGRRRPHPPLRPVRPRGRRADGRGGARPSTAASTSSSTTPGRSIRRSVELSYDRFHDFERTMQLNYFGALRLILGLLPAMRERASRGPHHQHQLDRRPDQHAALLGLRRLEGGARRLRSRCIASEVVDDGVHITTIHMPLVRTPMIAPTRMYDAFPTITPEEAAEMITDAMITKPKKVATRLGTFGELLYASRRRPRDAILNTAYKLFPESQAAKGKEKDGKPAEKDAGALDRGRRLRAPDERRALVGAAATATRRLQALGLGIRGPAARRASSSRGSRRRSPSRLGFGVDEIEEPVPLEAVELPGAAAEAAEARSRRSSRPTATTASRTPYGKAYRDVVRGFRGEFANPPDLVAFPRRSRGRRGGARAGATTRARRRSPSAAAPASSAGVEPRIGDDYPGVGHDRPAAHRPGARGRRRSRARRGSRPARPGPRLEDQLREHGLTLRHFPQSFEYSTLGGWIATRAGGHFATLYTHIDDLVESVRAITPARRLGEPAAAGLGRRARARTGC